MADLLVVYRAILCFRGNFRLSVLTDCHHAEEEQDERLLPVHAGAEEEQGWLEGQVPAGESFVGLSIHQMVIYFRKNLR